MTRILTAWADEMVGLYPSNAKEIDVAESDNLAKQREQVRDYVAEMNEERRQREKKEEAERRRLAKRGKYKHEPGEPLWKFIWKEIVG